MDIGSVPKNRGHDDGGESAATSQNNRIGTGTAATKNKK